MAPTKFEDLPSEVMLRILSYVSISTVQSVSLTSSTLNHLTKFPQLYRDLDLSNVHLMKSVLPESIARPLRVCKNLSIRSPTSISRRSMAAILETCAESPNLDSIRITGVTTAAEDLQVFFEQCKGHEGLKEVTLSRCSIPSEPIIKLLDNHGGGLTKLSLKFSDIEDDVLDKIISISTYPSFSPASSYASPSTPSTPSVKSNLSVKAASPIDEMKEKTSPRPILDRTRGQNSITHLSLAGCFSLTPSGFQRLFSSRPAVRNIEKIDLRWNDEVSTNWFRNPDMFPSLKELDIRGCGGVTGQDVRDLKRRWGGRLVVRETACEDERYEAALGGKGWGCLEGGKEETPGKWGVGRVCPV